MIRRYLKKSESARFYKAGMEKSGIILRASAGDYRQNKKAKVVVFYFLCWEYLLLLDFVFRTVRVFFL